MEDQWQMQFIAKELLKSHPDTLLEKKFGPSWKSGVAPATIFRCYKGQAIIFNVDPLGEVQVGPSSLSPIDAEQDIAAPDQHVELQLDSDNDEGYFDVAQIDVHNNFFHDLVKTSLSECQRGFKIPSPGHMRRTDMDSIVAQHGPLHLLHAFLPPLDEVLKHTNKKGQEIHRPSWSVDQATFYTWLWVRMTQCTFGNRADYWKHCGFEDIMTKNRFNEILAAFTLPLCVSPTPAQRDPFHGIRRRLEMCNTTWQESWEAGSFIITDKSMVPWTGCTSDVHLTPMPRKPSPLGVCLKTLADCSNILLLMELVEGQEVDSKKELFADFGATTSCILRLTLWVAMLGTWQLSRQGRLRSMTAGGLRGPCTRCFCLKFCTVEEDYVFYHCLFGSALRFRFDLVKLFFRAFF